MNTKQRNTS